MALGVLLSAWPYAKAALAGVRACVDLIGSAQTADQIVTWAREHAEWMPSMTWWDAVVVPPWLNTALFAVGTILILADFARTRRMVRSTHVASRSVHTPLAPPPRSVPVRGQEGGGQPSALFTDGWLEKRLIDAKFAADEVYARIGRCASFLRDAGLATEQAVDALVSDGALREEIQQLYRSQLRDDARVLEAYGFCKWAPRLHLAPPGLREAVRSQIAAEIRAHLDPVTGKEKTRDVQDRELAVAGGVTQKPVLAFEFVDGAPPFRQEIHLPDLTQQFGKPAFDVFFNVKLFLSRGAVVDDVEVTLQACLAEDGNDHGAFDLQLLPQPLQERDDVPAPGQPYQTRFTLRRNEERYFRVLRWRTIGPDARSIYVCVATHHRVYGVPGGSPPRRYRLLVRATSIHGIAEQWLSAWLAPGLHVQPLPPPDLRFLTPEILDELANLLTKAWLARPHAFSTEPASVNEAFGDRVAELRDRFETLRPRLDAFTQEMFSACIKAMAFGHCRLGEVPYLAETQQGTARHEAANKLAEVSGFREGIIRWFTIARRLMADRAERERGHDS